MYIKEGYSSYKIAEMLNIRSKTQVQNWVKIIKIKVKLHLMMKLGADLKILV
ncbi:hypothetical protein KK437_11865 [Clostridioides difficile]|nr:hypothetical protein [Clostridioides difficile]